jgi:hypothetical protein
MMKKEPLTTTKNNAKISKSSREEKEKLAISLLMKLNAEQLENLIKEYCYGQQRTGFKT